MAESIALPSGLHLPAAAVYNAIGVKARSGGLGGTMQPGGTVGGSWTRLGMAMGGSDAWNPSTHRLTNYETFLQAVDIPWVWPCLTSISWTYGESKHTVVSGKVGKELPIAPSDDLERLEELLKNPNPYMSGYDLRVLLCQHLVLTGNAFLVMDNLDGKKRPTELYLLRPSNVRIKPSPKTYVDYYLLDVNGQQLKFPVDRVIWFKTVNPRDPYWGIGTIEAGTAIFEKSRAISRVENNYFASGARVKGVLTYDGILTDEQETDLRAQWRDMDEGQAGELKTAILQAGMDYKAIGADLLSNGPGMETLSTLNRNEILYLFGTPPAMVGIFEQNVPVGEQQAFFQATTMRPMLRGTNFGWTQLVKRFNPAWEYRHEEIAVTDYLNKATTAHYFGQSGSMEVNEIRNLVGIDPLDQNDPRGKWIVVPSSMAYMTPEGTIVSMAPMAAGGDEDPNPKQRAPEQGATGEQPPDPTTPAKKPAPPAPSTPNPQKTPMTAPPRLASVGVGRKSCGCPERVSVHDKATTAASLGVCAAHAPAVDKALDLGRLRRYSTIQMQDGYPKEGYAGVNGTLVALRPDIRYVDPSSVSEGGGA